MWILPKNYPLSSHFAQGMVASKEDLTCAELNIESSLMWRSKPTQLRTWLQKWNKGNWTRHLFIRILKHSQRKSFETALTSSLAAIPASRSVCQETGKEQTTPDISGRTYGDTLNQLDLFSASSRTSRDTSRLDSPQLSATWKKMVIEQRGEFSQRVKLAHPTSVSEFSYFPTATVFDVTGGNYPTEMVNGQWRSKHSKDPKSPWYGAKLRDAVETAASMWQTPTCHIAKEGAYPAEYTRNTISLTAQAVKQGKNWPTPDVAQAQKVSNRPNYGQLGLANHPEVHGKTVDREPMKKDRSGQPGQEKNNTNGSSQESYGKLNPAWVEQLMGVPTGWTDLDSWVTQLSHKPQQEPTPHCQED